MTGHYRPGQFAGRIRQGKWNFRFLVWWPIRRRSAGPPGPGRGSAQTIFPRGQPHRVYATDLWPALALDNYSRSKSDRAPRQRLIDSG